MAQVTAYGFQETAKLLTAKSGTAFSYMAVGTGTTAEGPAVSALVYEITASGLSRTSCTVNTATSVTLGDTATFVNTWTATGSYNVQEAGVLNSSASGALLCYATFSSAVPMASADTLQITWSVKCETGA